MENYDEVVKKWTEAYENETLDHAVKRSTRLANQPDKHDLEEQEIFAQTFHTLIHASPSLSTTLSQLEHDHAVAIAEKCAERDVELQRAENMQKVGGPMDDMLSPEDLQMLGVKWESDISHLKETQRREFRDWAMMVYESLKTKNSEDGIKPMSKSDSAYFMMSGVSHAPPSGGAVSTLVPQESFTITLGAQMKQMHNLRLVAADALDLTRYDILKAPNNSVRDGFGEEGDWLPRRLQTAMSLYSHNLAGLVLLTDDTSLTTAKTEASITRDFASICFRSTEYHFPNFEQQLEYIRGDQLKAAMKWREDAALRRSVFDPPEEQDMQNPRNGAEENKGKLKAGDFYITKHSNLCEVHVVFHMIANCTDNVAPLTSSEGVNSRHPVVMGLRSVLKTASNCGITQLTIPLLLSMKMTEEMTAVAWCLRRAELVFKCVKGFMMEVASCGGGEDLKTLQFLVPKDIDKEVFNRLTSMLASIFRSSNPIKGY